MVPSDCLLSVDFVANFDLDSVLSSLRCLL